MASPDDMRWARVKASAARWFARLDAEQQSPGPAAARAACVVVARRRR
jgi:hypothetical protein